MKNTKINSSTDPENKIEKILGHRTISEYDPKRKSYFYIREYRIKWTEIPKPMWVKESNLGKYKKIVNNYNKLFQNQETKYNLMEKDLSSSLYTELNMRIEDYNFPSEEAKITPNFINNEISEKQNKYGIIYKKDKKDGNKSNNNTSSDDKNNNLKESFLEINENDQKKSLDEESDKNIIKQINNFKQRNPNKLINKPKFSKFGPSFLQVLNANKNEKLKEKEEEEHFLLLNKKRKGPDLSESYTISIDEEDSEKEINQKENNKFNISKIIIPSDKNKPISVVCKNKYNEKKIITNQDSNSENTEKEALLKCYEQIIKTNIKKISKEELINCYELIIKKYFAGNTFNFD